MPLKLIWDLFHVDVGPGPIGQKKLMLGPGHIGPKLMLVPSLFNHVCQKLTGSSCIIAIGTYYYDNSLIPKETLMLHGHVNR